jgi:hypothetical protein
MDDFIIVIIITKVVSFLIYPPVRRVGWRDTSNRPDERGGQEHQPGGKNIVSELVEAVRCAKSLG